MMMDGSDGWGWGTWLLMVVVMVLFWGAVAILVIAGVRRLFPRHGADVSWQRQTENLLAQRLARGEIDETEYRQRLVLLRESP
jgi:putative membrane protein